MLNAESTIDQIQELPTLPTIYTNLMEVTSNPRSTAKDVAEVIVNDQSTSAKVIRVVNSSVYRLQTRVDSITQAVFYLGYKEIRNIVLSISIFEMFSKVQKTSNFDIVEFWKHSIAVGVLTRTIGNISGVTNLDNYFLAGIIHDIGKLIFLKISPENYDKVALLIKDKDLTILEAERKTFGINHTKAGAILANKWKLPDSLKNAINYHNTGFVNNRPDKLTASVHIADIMARMMRLGKSGEEKILKPNFNIWEVITFKPENIGMLYDRIMMDFNQAASILMLDKKENEN